MKTLRYETRDANGNDIVKDVVVKEFASVAAEFKCPVCGKDCREGIRTADIISGSFTDYAFIGDYVCSDCADLFSLYFYNYVKDADGIRLLNIRSIRDEITRGQKPPPHHPACWSRYDCRPAFSPLTRSQSTTDCL